MSELNLSTSDAAVQNRKFAKTCVEKKRRDRINRCLDELKDLMSQADDKARYQKMEKAEILEMAVTYMRNLRASGKSGEPVSSSSPHGENSLHYYTLAFRQCINDFQNFLCVCPNIQDEFKSQIMGFMSQRYMEVMASASSSATKSETVQGKAEDLADQDPSSASSSGMSSQSSQGHAANVTKKHKLLAARYSPYDSKLSPLKKQHRISSQNEENEQQLNLMTIRSHGTSANELTSTTSSAISSPTQSSYLYQQKSKFGGSCSSLDSFMGGLNAQPASPSQSITSSSSDCHNDSNRSQLLVASNTSSPAPSACSSPNKNVASSSVCKSEPASNTQQETSNQEAKFNQADLTNMQMAISMAISMNPNLSQLAALNFELYQNALMKVWRPW